MLLLNGLILIMNIEIKKFNLDNIIKNTNNVAIIGRRSTGKTVLVKKILAKFLNKNIDEDISGVIFNSLSRIKPYESIEGVTESEQYDSNVLKNLIEAQITNNRKPAFVVMDNINLTKEIKEDRYFTELFINGRHYNIFVILVIPPATLASPCIRANIDYIFIAKENSVSMRKKLYKYYECSLSTYSKFIEVFTMITSEKYRFMVINNACDASIPIYHY